jgi:hypothetical protein
MNFLLAHGRRNYRDLFVRFPFAFFLFAAFPLGLFLALFSRHALCFQARTLQAFL